MKNDVSAVAKSDFSLIDENMLKSRIYTIRGLKVMLDADLRFMGIARRLLINRLRIILKSSMKIFAFSWILRKLKAYRGQNF